MSFKSETIETERGWQVSLSGHLDTTTCNDLERSLLAMFEKSAIHISIDFSTLDYISSAGLRVFLIVAKRAKQSGGTLTLCGMQPGIKNVFAISGLLKILDVIDDCEIALSRFGN
jgi:anti-anti-sigma factor